MPDLAGMPALIPPKAAAVSNVLYIEQRHNQTITLYASQLFYIQCPRNNRTCPAMRAYDNTVLSAYTSALFTVKINVVVRVTDVPELIQSQVCKISRCSIPNYRQGPRACKNFLFCCFHFPQLRPNRFIMAVRPINRTAIIQDACPVF